jgi:hypothetical protein
MNKPAYISLLTPGERAASVKIGAMLKCSELGIKQSQVSDVLSPSNAMKAIAVASLLGGVPLGVAAHIIGRRISGVENREKEMKEKIKYYRNATRGLETGLESQAKEDTTDTSAT